LVSEKLKQELDFPLEGKNCERCKETLVNIPNATVPGIRWDLTGDRILTMEFIDGIKLDKQKLTDSGIDASDIVKRLIQIFSLQIFRYGFVHVDPHHSNSTILSSCIVLVRLTPTGGSEIVLLDHGLYEEIDLNNQQMLASFWVAGVTSDIRELKRISSQLGVSDYTILWEIFFQRPFLTTLSGQLKLLSRLTGEERRILIQKMSAERFESISQTLQILPPLYILILRNINLIRSIAHDLSQSTDRYHLIAK
ncbi:hypothetical protein MXB_803, partial [Myxobolus squamalis]